MINGLVRENTKVEFRVLYFVELPESDGIQSANVSAQRRSTFERKYLSTSIREHFESLVLQHVSTNVIHVRGQFDYSRRFYNCETIT